MYTTRRIPIHIGGNLFLFVCFPSGVRASKISANLFNIKLCSTNFFCHSFILDIRHNKQLCTFCTFVHYTTQTQTTLHSTHQSTFDKRVCHFFQCCCCCYCCCFSFFCFYLHLFSIACTVNNHIKGLMASQHTLLTCLLTVVRAP